MTINFFVVYFVLQSVSVSADAIVIDCLSIKSHSHLIHYGEVVSCSIRTVNRVSKDAFNVRPSAIWIDHKPFGSNNELIQGDLDGHSFKFDFVASCRPGISKVHVAIAGKNSSDIRMIPHFAQVKIS